VRFVGDPVALAEVYAGAVHVVRATISQQAYALVPMEARGIVVDCCGQRRHHDLRRHPELPFTNRWGRPR
jgi:hypothetical protein